MINGKTLKEFQIKHDLNVIEMCYLFGLASPTNYNQLTKNEGPLQPTVAILLILYENFDEMELKTRVEPEGVYEKVKNLSNDEMSFRHFSIMLGKFHTAYSSWQTKGVEPTQTTNRLLYILNAYLDKKGKKGYKKIISMIEEEAKDRDIEHIFTDLSWRVESESI